MSGKKIAIVTGATSGFGKIFAEGFMIGILTLVAFSIGNKYYGLEVARTMAFMTIGLLELLHSFNIKSEKSIFKTGLFENKYLIGALLLGIFVQSIVVVLPPIAKIFELTNLNLEQWIITIGISILPIPIIELQKHLNEKRDLGTVLKIPSRRDFKDRP